jgi:competence protein ComEA
MRHFTLASITAVALTLGLIATSPSQAQTPQPAAKSDKMAPAPKAAPADAKMAPAKSDAAKLLDINTASSADLEVLPGIGTAYSKKIIDGRPYNGKDDLVNRGILPQKTYDGIADKIIAKQASKAKKS